MPSLRDVLQSSRLKRAEKRLAAQKQPAKPVNTAEIEQQAFEEESKRIAAEQEDKAKEAARVAKAAAKEAAAAAKAKQAAENNVKEAAWRRDRRPMYVDAGGVIQSHYTDEEWAAEKAKKGKKLQDEKAKAEAEKQQKQALAAVDDDVAVTKANDQAIQRASQQQALDRDAEKAKYKRVVDEYEKRLKDISDGKLEVKNYEGTVKSMSDTIAQAKQRLAALDAQETARKREVLDFDTQQDQRRAELDKQAKAIKRGELPEPQKKTVAEGRGAPLTVVDGGAKPLITDRAQFEAAAADLTQKQQALKSANAQRAAEMAKLEQENARLLSLPHTAADLSKDGKWHKDMIPQVNAKVQKYQQDAPQEEAARAELDAQAQHLNASAKAINEQAAAEQVKEKAEQARQAAARKQQLADLAAAGHETQAQKIQSLDREAEARLADIAEMYPENSPERQAAVKAVQQDIASKHAAVGKEIEQQGQKAAKVYQDWGKGFAGNWITGETPAVDDEHRTGAVMDESVNEVLKSKAKQLGMTEKDLRHHLETQRLMDWTTPSTTAANKQQSGIAHELAKKLDLVGVAEPTRTLPSGDIMPNPELGQSQAKFNEAIDAAIGTKAAKDRAKALWPQYREMWIESARATLETSETLPGVESYMQWRDNNNAHLAGMTENQKAELYIKKMEGRSGLRKFLDNVSSNLMAGSHDILTAIYGTGAILSGAAEKATGADSQFMSQLLSEQAAEKSQQAQKLTQAQSIEGINGLVQGIAGQSARMLPGVAATMATGTMTGAMVAGAMQTGGMAYGDAYHSLIEQGYDHADAWAQAAPASTAAGAMTAVLTKAFPGGVTALNNAANRSALKQGIQQAIRTFAASATSMGKAALKGFVDEVPQEILDEAFSQFAQGQAEGRDPREVVSEFLTGLPELIGAAGLMGAGGEVIGSRGQGKPGVNAPAIAPVSPPSPAPPLVGAVPSSEPEAAPAAQTAPVAASAGAVEGGNAEARPEKWAAAEAALASFADNTNLPPDVADKTAQKGRVLIKIAQGAQPESLDNDDLHLVGLHRDDLGKITQGYMSANGWKKGPNPNGSPQPVEMLNGEFVITDRQIERLRNKEVGLGSLADAIALPAGERRAQILAKETKSTNTDETAPQPGPAASPAVDAVQGGAQETAQTGDAPARGGQAADAPAAAKPKLNRPQSVTEYLRARYGAGFHFLTHQTTADIAEHIATKAKVFGAKMGIVGTSLFGGADIVGQQLQAVTQEGKGGGRHRGSDGLVVLAVPKDFVRQGGRVNDSVINDEILERIAEGDTSFQGDGRNGLPNEYIVGHWANGEFHENPNFIGNQTANESNRQAPEPTPADPAAERPGTPAPAADAGGRGAVAPAEPLQGAAQPGGETAVGNSAEVLTSAGTAADDEIPMSWPAKAAAETPAADPEQAQRATEISRELAKRGLDEATAQAVAAEIVGEQGVIGDNDIAQMTDAAFEPAMRARGWRQMPSSKTLRFERVSTDQKRNVPSSQANVPSQSSKAEQTGKIAWPNQNPLPPPSLTLDVTEPTETERRTAVEEVKAQMPDAHDLIAAAVEYGPQLARFKAMGGQVRVVKNAAEAAKILGHSNSKSKTGVTQRVNGVPTVVIINPKGNKEIRLTLFHELVHGVQKVYETLHPDKVLAASRVLDQKSPEFDRELYHFVSQEYGSFVDSNGKALDLQQKLAEATRAIIEGRYRNETSSKATAFKGYLKDFMAYIKAFFKGSKNPALIEMVRNIETALGIDQRAEVKTEKVGNLKVEVEASFEQGVDPFKTADYAAYKKRVLLAAVERLKKRPDVVAARKEYKEIEARLAAVEKAVEKLGHLFDGIDFVTGAPGAMLVVRAGDQFRLQIDLPTLLNDGAITELGSELQASEEVIHALIMAQLPPENVRRIARSLPDDAVDLWWKSYYAAGITSGQRGATPPANLLDNDEAAYHFGHEFLRMLVQDKIFKKKFMGLIPTGKGMTTESGEVWDKMLTWLKELLQNISRQLNNVRKQMPESERAAMDSFTQQVADTYKELVESGKSISEWVYWQREAAKGAAKAAASKNELDEVEPPARAAKKPAAAVDDVEDQLAAAADAEMKPQRTAKQKTPTQHADRLMSKVPGPSAKLVNIITRILGANGVSSITRPSAAWMKRMAQEGNSRKTVGDWDWLDTSNLNWWETRLFPTGNGSNIDQELQRMHAEGYFPEVAKPGDVTGAMLLSKIRDTLAAYERMKAGGPVTHEDAYDFYMAEGEMELRAEETAQRQAFEKATATGKMAVNVGELREGDMLLIEGERVEVMQVKTLIVPKGEEFDPDSNPAQFKDPSGVQREVVSVTLKDGKVFGWQELRGHERIKVDGVKDHTEADYHDKLAQAIHDKMLSDGTAVAMFMDHEGMDADTPWGEIVSAMNRKLRIPVKRLHQMLQAVFEEVPADNTWSTAEKAATMDSPLGAGKKRQGDLETGRRGDAEYMAAVESGDMEKAQRMVDAAAKAAGFTEKAYHGTAREFNVFKGNAFFFTRSKASAESFADLRGGNRVVEAFINPGKSYNEDFKGGSWQDMEDKLETLFSKYDSAEFDNVWDRTGDTNQLIVWDSNRVKSADPVTRDEDGNVIPLSQRFNPESDSILYSAAKRAAAKPLDPQAADDRAQMEWLNRQAKALGAADVDELFARNKDLFNRLAAEWRVKHARDNEGKLVQNEAIRGIFESLYGSKNTYTRRPDESGQRSRSLAAEAEAHTRGMVRAGEAGPASPTAESLRAEKARLIDWARDEGLLLHKLPEQFTPYSPLDHGNMEHHVFYAGDRVLKINHEGHYGIWPVPHLGEFDLRNSASSPLRYLQRVVETNGTLGDDIVLHGVLADRQGNVQMITSQPRYSGSKANDEWSALPEDTPLEQRNAVFHAAVAKVRAYFAQAGFVPVGSDNRTYYRPSDNTAIFDAHLSNLMWVTGDDGKLYLVPFDVTVMHPTGQLAENFKALAPQTLGSAAKRSASGPSLFGADEMNFLGDKNTLGLGEVKSSKSQVSSSEQPETWNLKPETGFALESTTPAQLDAEARRKKLKAELQARQDKPLIGTQGDIGQMDMLGGNDLFSLASARKRAAADPQNLAVVHNLSIANLRHVLKMGGLAVPSVAVIRTDKTTFDAFGDVTLIAKPQFIDPQRDRAAKVFNADVYSPRYPKVTLKFKEGDGPKIAALLKPYHVELATLGKDSYTYSIGNLIDKIKEDGFTEAGHNALAVYAYLRTTGKLEAPTATTDGTEFIRRLDELRYSKTHHSSEVANWLEQTVRATGIEPEERIFNGFTPLGNRKYLPHDLDTVVKLLKKSLKDGEGFNYGVPSIRAANAKPFRTLKAIQEARDHIVTTAEMDALKEEVNSEFEALSSELETIRKVDAGMDSISDDMKAVVEGGSENWRHLREMYGDNLNDALALIRPFLDKLRHMPTEYFEGKMQRAVGLNEFSAAAVPDDLPADLQRELDQRGIKTAAYKSGDKTARAEAVRSLAQENQMLFSAAKRSAAPAESTPFYSKLSRVIAEKMPNRADVQTIKGIISNPQTGIKAEELKWSGIVPWLDAQTAPITKQSVLDYLASDGAVRLEEVRHGEKAKPLTPEETEERKRLQNSLEPWTFEEINRLRELNHRVLATADENYPFYPTKFAQYQLPGDENYREVVLAMPLDTTPEWKAWEKMMAEVAAKYPKHSAEYIDAAMKSPMESGASEYTSSHFPDVPNYVAHMRLNDRTDAEGKPGTFIEEIQSDRHQAGRDKGYQGDFSTGKAKQYLDSLPAKLRPDAEYLLKNPTATGDATTPYWNRLNEGAPNIDHNAIHDIRDTVGDDGPVADAPFRTTWPLQMFKRALADAVAQGKAWIGWTTGETQAERYKLSRQLGTASLLAEQGDRYTLALEGTNGERLFRNENGFSDYGQKTVTAQELETLVGKPLAQKLVEGANKKKQTKGSNRSGRSNQWFDVEGEGLNIGGEGMRGFYDTILPKEIGKYVKQWGAGVVKGEISSMPQGYTITFKGGYYEVRSPKDGVIGREDSREDAERTIRRYHNAGTMKGDTGNHPIWRVDITPQMRAGVEAGQALFSAPKRSFTSNLGDSLKASAESFKTGRRGDGEAGRLNPDLKRFIDVATKGLSTAYAPLERVFLAAKSVNRNLTEREFGQMIAAADAAGQVMLEPAESPATVEKANVFGVRMASGVPAWGVALNPELEQEATEGTERLQEEPFKLDNGQIQAYLELPDVNVPASKQPAAKRAIRAAGAVSTTAYEQPLPARRGGAGQRDRLADLRERAQRKWRGLMNQDVEALKEAFQESDSFSNLLHQFTTREIPSFDIRGAIIEHPADFAAFSLAVRSPFFETLKIAIVDNANQVIHSQVVHVGGLNEAIADPKTIAGIIATTRMLYPKARLSGWIIAHNHPSGDPSPSDADRRITRRFVAMGEHLGLPMLDHVVTNGERYFSFREHGMVYSSIEAGIDLRASRAGKPKLPVLPTPPRPDFGNVADWEVVPSGSMGAVANSPTKALPYLRALRTADPDYYHVLYLDTRLSVRAVERLPTTLSAAQMFQRIALGSAREGAYGFTLGFPVTAPASPEGITVTETGNDWIVKIKGRFESMWSTEAEAREWAAGLPAPLENTVREDDAHLPTDQQRRMVRTLQERADAVGLKLLDAMNTTPDKFYSWAEAGLMESPAEYGQALGSAAKRPPSTPWPTNFPDVVVHTNVVTMKKHADYTAAKAGDEESAMRLVRALMKPARVADLAKQFPKAMFAAVHAEEATGRNKIPLAISLHAAQTSGLTFDDTIVQTNRVHHTGADAAARLGRTPNFQGRIEIGRDYIVVDDVTTSGSSLAGLRDYIETHGGKVVAAMTLATTSNPQTGYGGYLALKPETRSLLSRFDKKQLESILQAHGVAESIEALTNSQGRYIATFTRLDTLRDRLTSAGQAGVSTTDAQTLTPEQKRLDSQLMMLGSAAKRSPVDAAAHEAATSPLNDLTPPTPAQKDEGNYKKGHPVIGGHAISIENPAGSKRRPEWPVLKDHYGYFKGTNAKDGDHVDVFVKPGTPEDYAGPVHVVRQVKVPADWRKKVGSLKSQVSSSKPGASGKLETLNLKPATAAATAFPQIFDEYKVMLGYATPEEARAAYLRNYEPGWPGLERLTTHSAAEFARIKDQVFTVPADRVPGVRVSDQVLASGAKRGQGAAMADPDKAAQSNEPSPGGLSEADAKLAWLKTLKKGAPLKLVDGREVVFNGWSSPIQGQRYPTFVNEWSKVSSSAIHPDKIIYPEFSRAENGTLGSASKRSALDKAAGFIGKTAPTATAAGLAQAGSAVMEKTGLQKPIAAFGSNKFDKFIFEHVMKPAVWDRVSSAQEAVKKWLNKPGALNGIGKAVIDQTLPLWNVPREWLAHYHEAQRKAAWGREKAMDVIRALSHDAKVSDLAYPKEFVDDPSWRVRMFDAMEGKTPMTELPEPLQKLAARLRLLLEETGRDLIKQGLLNLDTFNELKETGWMPRYTEDEAEAAGGSWLKAFKLGVKDMMAQRSTAFHIVDTTRKDPRAKDQYAIVSREEGGKKNRWRFRNAQHMKAFYEDFVKREAFKLITGKSDEKEAAKALLAELDMDVETLRKTLLFGKKEDRAPIEAKLKSQGANLEEVRQMLSSGSSQNGQMLTTMLAALNRDEKRRVREEIEKLSFEDMDLPGKLSPELNNIIRRAVEIQRVRYKKEKPFEPEKLIKDPVYSVARYVMAQTHNAATMELLKQTGKNKEWVSDVSLEGYTEIPDNPRFGPLAKKFLRADIATQVLEHVGVDGAAMQFYDSMLRKWKAGKLVLNPGSHVRDAVGNTVFAYLGGNSIWNPGNLPYYRDAITALRDGGDTYAELIEQQVLGGDAFTTQVKAGLKGLLPDTKTVEDMQPGAIARLFMGFGAGIRGSYEYLSELRKLPDDFYKTAAYLKYKSQGMSPAAAAAEVRKWFPYYDRLGSSAAWKQTSRFAMPFSAFFRESTRVLGRAAMERPLALATSLSFAAMVTRYSLMMLGLGDDDEEAIKRSMRGKLKFSETPVFSMLLPDRTDEGQLQQWDISAVMPFADLLGSKVETREGEDTWTRFFRSMFTASPITAAAWGWSTNTDAFSGRKIVEEDMGVLESTGERIKDLAGDLLPPLTPFVGVHAATLENAGRRTGSLEMRNKYQSYLRAIVGLDVRSADPNLYTETKHFREKNNLPLNNNGNTYSTPLKSRLAKDIKGELIQDAPDLDTIATAMARLEASGNPIKSPKQMSDLLDSLDPAKIIKQEFRRKLINSFSPEAQRVYQSQQQEFQKANQRVPSAWSEARKKIQYGKP